MKTCTICKEEKELSYFAKKNKLKDGTQRYSLICKKCVNEKDNERRKTKEYKEYKSKYDKQYYIENNNKILEYKKQYHIDNRDKILIQKREYRKKPENKEKIKKYFLENPHKIKEAQKKYRDKHPHIIAWRRILYRTLYHLGKEKEGDTKNEMGYSAVQLKHHLEKLFKEGMSWKNYGEWEIDHITPLTLFDNNATCSEVNTLSNLQPLWLEENRRKYNNLI